ncbi:MAG: TIGR03758 family integrating conjugative element protein [Halorhodospira halophila]|uniref:DUF3262 family protein n=1 Tax=Halorhodospira TaxID=85108 RepID=UPI001EE85FDF|nr:MULTISPECIES: DUF3262 family protein [Halorhodospira]MCC3750847.1 TIGR03758 family integrating conjugative element protein [Halorhodospira halophila]MCG5537340.1 TIGR03758 family integrating conjugative element protein [Halorhodospira sp. 9622]
MNWDPDIFGTWSAVDPSTLIWVISAVVLAFYFIWAAWVSLSQFDGFRKRETEFAEWLWYTIRAVIVVTVVAVYVRPG